MALTYKDNPFKPDFGGIPPLLAGRSDEMQVMTVCLEQLQGGATPVTIIISAPRGMGKSVLLNMLSDEASNKGIKFRKKHAGDIKTVQGLTEWLAPETVEAARGGGRNIGGGVSCCRISKLRSYGRPRLW